MSDDAPSREEFERLKQRVAELEDQLSDTSDARTTSGLDHRDKAVLDVMRDSGQRSGVALVKLYISATDIQNRDTAKRRAKNLRNTEAYQNL